MEAASSATAAACSWTRPSSGGVVKRRSGPRRAPILFAGTGRRPIILADLPDRPGDADSVRRAAAGLAGSVDAVLFGDTGWARVQLPPSYRALLVAHEGVRPWAGLNCRDRNRVALEGELRALADTDAIVHCVTGDHTQLGHRSDARPVFDLDSLELTALACGLGLVVSVAENPVAPPVELRPQRAVEKEHAGARIVIVNHAGSPERVHWFVDATREAGGKDLVFLACVPLVASREGLALLRTFTGLALPHGYLAAIEEARDPFIAGVDQAVEFATAVLDVRGVAGINLSSAFPPGQEEAALAASLAVSRALGGR